jgi:hypothetical protein
VQNTPNTFLKYIPSFEIAPRLYSYVAGKIDEHIRIDLDIKTEELAAYFKYTPSAINRRKRELRRRFLPGGIVILLRKPSLKPLITPRIINFIQALYNNNLELYLDKIADYIYLEFDLKLSDSTISRYLKKIDITYKIS